MNRLNLPDLFTRTPASLRPHFFRALNLYPPYMGAGIRITEIASDLSAFDVEMRLLPWNRGLIGAHFGGSLYAMCDPFFWIALTTQLGPDYMVWDKSAQIDFRRPGRGTVRAHFAITPEQLARVRADVDTLGKCEPAFEVQVLGAAGEVVATVHKRLWVKKKSVISKNFQQNKAET